MKKSKELMIGLFLVLAIILLYVGIRFLKGANIFSKQMNYYAVYDNVDGLQPSNGVLVNGFVVGKVERIGFHPSKNGSLIVEFVITEENMMIPKNSTAKIVSFDILGTKGINLQMNFDAQDYYMPGDTILSSIETSLKDEVNQQVLPLKNKVEGLIMQFDSALGMVQGVFDEDFRNSVTTRFSNTMQSLENIALTTDVMMTTNSKKIGVVMSDMQSISGNLKNSNEELTNIIQNTSQITDTLASVDLGGTFNKVNTAMTDVSELLEKINSGEGSLGQLLNNDTLYDNLEDATLQLDLLLEDMRLNPKRYVHFSLFGGKDKKDKNKK